MGGEKKIASIAACKMVIIRGNSWSRSGTSSRRIPTRNLALAGKKTLSVFFFFPPGVKEGGGDLLCILFSLVKQLLLSTLIENLTRNKVSNHLVGIALVFIVCRISPPGVNELGLQICKIVYGFY